MYQKDTFPFFKYLQPKRLAELLISLPENCVVSTNRLGNLAIWEQKSDEMKFIGYIEFISNGEIEYR